MRWNGSRWLLILCETLANFCITYVVPDIVPEPLLPLNMLQLNDFVLLNIFSYLTEFEKYFCSQVCLRFRDIALATYADTIGFDHKLNKYFIPREISRRENLDQCYTIFRALGMYWKDIRISHNFSIVPVATVLKFVKKFCPNVENLTVHFDNVESKHVLNNLPKKLKKISLSVACRCKGNWLNPLKYCVNVEHLKLKFALENKKRILRGDFLQHFRNLKVLIFYDCRPSGLKKCFRNSIDLSVLELNYDLVNTSNRLIEIILWKLPKLQRIKLQPIQSIRLDKLGLLQNLNYLSLDSWVPNDLNSLLRNLIAMNKVQCFELDNCQSLVHSEIISDLHNWTSKILACRLHGKFRRSIPPPTGQDGKFKLFSFFRSWSKRFRNRND